MARTFTAQDASEMMNRRNLEAEIEYRDEHPFAATDKQVRFIVRLAKKDYAGAGRIIIDNGANVAEPKLAGWEASRKGDIEDLACELTKREASAVIDILLGK